MPVVHFIDVTNRDAVQAPRIKLAKLQKTMLNIYLGQLGIYQSEMGFPYARHEQNYFRANLELQEKGVMGNLVLEGWCRALVQDVVLALETGVKHLNLSISTSDQMIVHKFLGKLDRDRVIGEMVEAVKFAKAHSIQTVGVNAEDASRTDMGYLLEFAYAAREVGADRLRYCDTLGYDTPMTIYERVRAWAEATKLPIELHCHNDLGMAVANSVAGAMAALDAGVDTYINATVNGLGERAGNADLLSCILGVKLARGMDKYPIGDPLNLKMAARLAKYISHATGLPIAVNQPGVGANAFAHESGIHADGALKNRRNYELYDWEMLGIESEERIPTGRLITTGEYGGLAGVKHVFGKLGIFFANDEEAERTLELVRYGSAHTQIPLTDDELQLIARYPEQVRKVLTINP